MKTLTTAFKNTGETYVYDNGQYGEVIEVRTREVYELIANNTALYCLTQDQNLRKITSFSIGFKGLTGELLDIYNKLIASN